MFEHIRFHYMTIGSFRRGIICEGQQMMTVRNAHILPVINTDEVPEDESYQSIACFQEVVDKDNHHVLIYFGIVEQHFGE